MCPQGFRHQCLQQFEGLKLFRGKVIRTPGLVLPKQGISRSAAPHSLGVLPAIAALLTAIYRQLRKRGPPIPANDMWIAALVLEHSLVLFARDRHFDLLPQLTRV